MVKHRRKLSNLVVDRGALLRISMPFIMMALVSLAIVFAIRWVVIGSLEHTKLQGPENLEAMNSLLDLQRSVTSIGTIGILMLTAMCLASWVFISHRIFGPTIPIRRHIQKLVEGDYTSRIHTRAGDEFRNVTEELNHLAEVLDEKAKNK